MNAVPTEVSYNIFMLQTPILVSDEPLMINDLCYGVDINNGWAETVHGAGSHDVANKHPKLIAGLTGYPSLDLSDEVADIIAKEIGWVDVEKLAVSAFRKKFNREPIIMGSAEADSSWLNTWISGFIAAQSLAYNKFSEEDMISLISEIGFVKTSPEKLNSKEYQPFFTDEEGEIWTINKEHLLYFIDKMLSTQSKPKVYKVEVEMEDYARGCDFGDLDAPLFRRHKITKNTIKILKIKK